MSIRSKVLIQLALAAWLAWAVALPLAAAPSLVPAPLKLDHQTGVLQGQGEVSLHVEGDESFLQGARWLAEQISKDSGRKLALLDKASMEPSVRTALISVTELNALFTEAGLAIPGRPDEAYLLEVRSDGVSIQATHEAGLFYGLVSLWQWTAVTDKDHAGWQAVRILDAPEFAWRGLMLDSARHMQSVEFIKRYIDWLALHKMNTFHWHLSDDQAWRLEIKAYPRLTEVGGYRVPAGDAPAADIDPTTGQPRLYGGYYSQDQVREVVAHAASRQVQVIPEIDVPGHTTAALVAYPELGVEGFEVDKVSASWGIFHSVLNLEESTFEFLEAVLGEVVELFPAPFVHLGGDEVETEQWAHSPRIQQRMAELGLANYQQLQNHYVERLQAYLDKHNKRAIGWDEILQSDLPAHAAVMSWRGVEGAIEAAGKGHQTILSPAPTLYLDHLQTEAADAPPGRGGVITTRDIYEFDPLPGNLAANREFVLGVQGNLWTEHVRTEQRAAYMTWPRAAAIAELGWSHADQRNWESFSRRLPDAVTRLQGLGVNVATERDALYGEKLAVPADPNRRQDRELQLCSNAIVLALEDDAPINGDRASFLVDIQNPCWIWPAADLSKLNSVAARVGQLPFNFEIGAAIDSIVVEPSDQGPGELRVRLGACDGPLIAALPLAPAVESHEVTALAAAPVSLPSDTPSQADLCFSFARQGIEPIWVLDEVVLGRSADG